jgi:2-oxoisovalerate dehydrogenase E1 component
MHEYNESEALSMLHEMYRIRVFEETCKQLHQSGEIKGYCHLYSGLESIAVGLKYFYQPEDVCITSYRCHGHILAMGTSPSKLFAEMMGKNDGICKGHGGSMHLFDKDRGFYGGHGIVGSQVPLGLGLAFAKKYLHSAGICFTYLGDGSINQGQVIESLNMAALWKLPVIFIIENNNYSIGTHISESTANTDLWKVGNFYNINGMRIEGIDIFSILEAAETAVRSTRSGNGPCIIEIVCNRLDKHSQSHNISKAQEQVVQESRDTRDCIAILEKKILKNSNNAIYTERQILDLRNMVDDEMLQAHLDAKNLENATILPSAYLSVEDSTINASVTITNEHGHLSYREALNKALAEILEEDSRAFILGEDVGDYGGAKGITKGLESQFGSKRIVNTPVSEAGFTGLAVGASYSGLRPIVEYMSFNFVLLAADQIINSASKIYFMSGGQINAPIVFRGSNGHQHQLSAQHNQCYASWFSHCPGLVVLAPSNPLDAYLMLKAAFINPNPVILLEHDDLYGVTQELRCGDYKVPAIFYPSIVAEGRDISLVAYSHGVHLCNLAAEKLLTNQISCEVIDLRCLSPLNIDIVKQSFDRTQHLLLVEDGWENIGIASEICTKLIEAGCNLNANNFRRIGMKDLPMPFAAHLEKQVKIDSQKIADYVIDILQQRTSSTQAK